MRRPIRFPGGEGLSSQQQIDRLGQPLLYNGAGFLVSVAKKPPLVLKAVAVTLLVLNDSIKRHKFTCNYFSHFNSIVFQCLLVAGDIPGLNDLAHVCRRTYQAPVFRPNTVRRGSRTVSGV